jgi:hypothetical protein
MKARYFESHVIVQVIIRKLLLKKFNPNLPYGELKFER